VANENMRTSTTGMAALRRRENISMRYYVDLANNCTYGVGTLAHTGPCTAEELRRPVTIAQVNSQLANKVQEAESTVRRHVRNQQLTQAQFDALVSFVYNMGPTGAATVLTSANSQTPNEVATRISRAVYIHPRDAQGRRLAPVRSQGVANRRNEEAAPFQRQQANR
jgi:lysozyme